MKIMSKNSLVYFFLVFFISISSYAASSTTTTTPASPAPETQPSSSTATAPANNFPQTLKLGDQDWKLSYSNEDSDSQIAEYVTNDENVNNWTQLVTYQKFKFDIKKELTPSAFAQIEIDQLKSHGYTAKTAITDASAQEAIFEFRVSAPKTEQQDELQRIIKTADNKIIVLHYVTKKADMGQVDRTKWIGILKGIDLAPFAVTPKNS